MNAANCDIDDLEVRPDIKFEIFVYRGGVRYLADVMAWRGDVSSRDVFLLDCELGIFDLRDFDLRYHDGMKRRELRDLAIYTLGELIAQIPDDL